MDLYAFVNNMPAIKKSLETLKTDTNTLRASASQLNDGECYESTFISRLTPFFVIYKSLIAVLSRRVFFFSAMRKVKRDLLNTLQKCGTTDCESIKSNISQLQTNIDFNKVRTRYTVSFRNILLKHFRFPISFTESLT